MYECAIFALESIMAALSLAVSLPSRLEVVARRGGVISAT